MEHGNKFLAKQLQALFIDGLWIANTNYATLLNDISYQTATTKVENVNTITHLVYHINYYLEGLVEVLKGGTLNISDKYSFDLPTDIDEQKWQKMKDTLIANATEFIGLVQKLDNEKLSADFVQPQYGTYFTNIHAVIEHSYYHLGQISILKKMIENKI